jgi:hypothetical protein
MVSPTSSFDKNELKGTFNPLSPYDDSPQLQAVLNKLIPDQARGASSRQRANVSTRGLTNGTLQRISQQTAGDIQDAKSLFQILPDMELAMQILVSSILSPKDLAMPKLNYTVESGRFNSEVTGKMLKTISNFFENTYKINDLLPKILEDVLFYTGSYPLLILPENAIDEIINRPERVSFESIVTSESYKDWTRDSIGLLGPATLPEGASPGTEHFGSPVSGVVNYVATIALTSASAGETPFDLNLRVVDNPDILKKNRLHERLRRDRVAQVMQSRGLSNQFHTGQRVAVESISASNVVTGYSNGASSFSDHALYRGRRNTRGAQVAVLPTPDNLSRPTVGHPLVMKIPSEAVIPVHVPGAPDDHVGYFLLIDEHGNPVNYESSRDFYSDMGALLQQNQTMTSQLIATTKRAQTGQTSQASQLAVQELERAYVDLVEMDLNQRLRNGVYGSNVQVARPTEVYRMMMARSFAQRLTQLLYVPAELMTYVAFRYNEYGVGESLMQKSKIIASGRATLLFANMMASVRNSVARTRLKIKLDPDDPDPEKIVEEYIHNHVRNSRGLVPIGIGEPNDIVAHLNNAAYEIEVDANGNTNYPDTSMMVEGFTSDKAKPDTTLEDAWRDRHLMSIGLPPELVVNARGPEFATQVVSDNLLLAKRVLVTQSQFLPFMDEFVQRFTVNSQTLMDELRQIVRDNVARLSRSERNGQKEAVADGQVEVDEDLTKLVQVVAEKGTDDSVQVDAVVYEFIQGIRTALPIPDLSQTKLKGESLEGHETMVNKMLDYYLDESFLGDKTMGKLADAVPSVKAALKAHLMRQYARMNNIIPEMDELVSFDPDDGPGVDLLKIQLSHQDGLRASLLGFMEHVIQQIGQTDKQYENAAQAAGVDGVGDPAQIGGDAGSSGGDSGGGFSDSFDMGGGLGDDSGQPAATGDEEALPTGEEGDTDPEENPDATDPTDLSQTPEPPAI